MCTISENSKKGNNNQPVFIYEGIEDLKPTNGFVDLKMDLGYIISVDKRSHVERIPVNDIIYIKPSIITFNKFGERLEMNDEGQMVLISHLR